MMLGTDQVLPAAFLSPKGKVLCDALVQQVDKHEYFELQLQCKQALLYEGTGLQAQAAQGVSHESQLLV